MDAGFKILHWLLLCLLSLNLHAQTSRTLKWLLEEQTPLTILGNFWNLPVLRNATASRIGNDFIIVVITPLSSTKYSSQQIFTLFLK